MNLISDTKFRGYFPCGPAGPGAGGAGNPLPSGIPSPEFGAGPGPAFTGLKVKPINIATTITIIHFFIS
jgi:hypothetical protein